MAGGIAHDFNNILAAILGNIELAALSTDSASEAYLLLEDAKNASIRAKDLTQQLLTFAKGGDPVRQTASMGKIIKESATFVLHGSSTVCECEIPEELWPVDVDAGQIAQVIQNIVLNARHAMPNGGVVAVHCENVSDLNTELLSSGSYIKLTFSDSGLGIPKEYLDKIFDPYFSTKQEGSGLGLAICHSIINKHGGSISVESILNKGTVFTIYLPASSKEIVVKEQPQSELDDSDKIATIMVMDDDEMVQNIVRKMLERVGYSVLQVENGHDAIELYREYLDSNRSIDIIIMDLTIPGGMGGREAAQAILKIDSDAKLIVASGYSNDPVMSNYREHGFQAAIAKPFQLAELKTKIHDLLAA